MTARRLFSEKENAIYDAYLLHVREKKYSSAYLVASAEQNIEKLLIMDHENKILHQRAMQLAILMCDLSLAISHLRQSLRLEHSDEEDALLAELLLQKGLLEIQTTGLYLNANTNKMRGDLANYTPRYYKALAYLMGDRKREALAEIEAILADKPTNIEALILRAKVHWSMEDLIQGNSHMWQAYLLDPKHPEVCEFIKRVQPQIKADLEAAAKYLLLDSFDHALSHLNKG